MSSYCYDGQDHTTRVGASNACTAADNATGTASTYDGWGRQVSTASGPSTARTVNIVGYDGTGSDPVSESVDPATGGPSSYLRADDPLALADAPATAASTAALTLIAGDGHGSPAMTVTAGAVGCVTRYDPYGTSEESNACTSPQKPLDLAYNSQRVDPTTGTYQLGERTYNPATAAFTTPDHYGPGTGAEDLSIATDPLTTNTYTYVNGDPVNLTDPNGHRPTCEHGEGDCQEIWRDYGHRQEAATEAAAVRESARQTEAYLEALSANQSCISDAIKFIRAGSPHLGCPGISINPVWGPGPPGSSGAVLLGFAISPDTSHSLTWGDLGNATKELTGLNDLLHCSRGSLGGCALFASNLVPIGRGGRLTEEALKAAASGHIVLGLAKHGLEDTAKTVGGKTLLDYTATQAARIVELAVANPEAKFTLSIEGLEPTGDVAAALEHAILEGRARKFPSRNNFTNWEIAQLADAGRLEDLTLVVRNGDQVPNPMVGGGS